MQVFRPLEVAEHNTESDAWVVYKGKVLDISIFIRTHPGGALVFTGLLGQDVTQDYDEAGHALSSLSLIDELTIGILEGEETQELKRHYLDPSRGTVYQVWKDISKEQYLEMMHSPRHIHGHQRLFDNPILDLLTKSPWWLVPLMWIPTTLILLYLGKEVGTWAILTHWLMGFLTWVFSEYFFHRFALHQEHRFPDNSFLRCLHFLNHGLHHCFPMDDLLIVYPPIFSWLMCGVFYKLFSCLFLPLETYLVLAGFLCGYQWYDVMHYANHHRIWAGAYASYMKKYHLIHHYRSPDLGFGVSNPVLDFVFGTEISMS
jgi:4-hydroxysphinganine ceramide fatty acyl 2-hydroxylase